MLGQSTVVMKEINTLKIYQKSHSFRIKVYPSIVLVTIYMNPNEFAKYIEYGVQAERKAIHDLMTEIFKEDFPGKKVFYSEDEINQYLENKGIEPESGGANFSKNTVFEIDLNDFEKSLDNIIKYVKKQSENYEKRNNPDKAKVVNKILKKYFDNK